MPKFKLLKSLPMTLKRTLEITKSVLGSINSWANRLDRTLDRTQLLVFEKADIALDYLSKRIEIGFIWLQTLARPYLPNSTLAGYLGGILSKSLASSQLFFRQRARYLFFGLQAAFLISLLLGGSIAALHTSADNLPKVSYPGMIQMSNSINVPQPNSKLKFGLFDDSATPTAYEKLLGSKLNIVAWFSNWNQSLINNKLRYSCIHGYVPEITWQSWGGANSTQSYSLADIASGTYDNLIYQDLLAVATVCKQQTVIIRFDHEMDAPAGSTIWYPWQGDPEDYVAAWQHIVSISRKIDPNIKWLWSPNRGTQTAALYYPGSKWVDYVGLTLNDTISYQGVYQNFGQFYGANQAVIESYNKPVIISETSYDDANGDKPAWITSMFDYAESNPKIVGLVWFNGVSTLAFNSTQANIAAFQQSLKNLAEKP